MITGSDMTKRLWLSIIVAALTLAVATPVLPARAQDATKVTATKKKIVVHKKRHRVARRHSRYPELEPYRSNGFVGEFPGSCAYDRAAGRCMIDLGYGRCVQCEIGGGGGRF